MVIQEGQFFKKVLGLRLSYLSKHLGVRQYILQELDDGHNILESVLHISVDGVQVDLVGDEKNAFVAELNALMPGDGDLYAGEVKEDTYDERKHRWEWWRDRISENSALGDALKQAVRQVLGYGQGVEVGGKYAGQDRSVEPSDSGQPRLTFRGRAADIWGESKEED